MICSWPDFCFRPARKYIHNSITTIIIHVHIVHFYSPESICYYHIALLRGIFIFASFLSVNSCVSQCICHYIYVRVRMMFTYIPLQVEENTKSSHLANDVSRIPIPSSSSRIRQRQVSWGPPPIAQNNTTQLPFKIDEKPIKIQPTSRL